VRAVAAAVYLAAAPALAFAGASATGSGRGPDLPDDPALSPVLEVFEEKLPVYEEIEATKIQVPARAIELGPKARMYRCWRLRLTGDKGRQAASVLERLASVQKALTDVKAKLVSDLLKLSAGQGPHETLRQRIRARAESLSSLSGAYQELLDRGSKAGVLNARPKGFLSERPSVTPLLGDDDYTMVYDEKDPDCRR